mmetsp:Transcript_116567/g.183341  ORF Transcript_116567/g.183341 Transcript_116567/m.183341 type:complete len:205 (+) Transcript_116567:313-927(+)
MMTGPLVPLAERMDGVLTGHRFHPTGDRDLRLGAVPHLRVVVPPVMTEGELVLRAQGRGVVAVEMLDLDRAAWRMGVDKAVQTLAEGGAALAVSEEVLAESEVLLESEVLPERGVLLEGPIEALHETRVPLHEMSIEAFHETGVLPCENRVRPAKSREVSQESAVPLERFVEALHVKEVLHVTSQRVQDAALARKAKVIVLGAV